jgi:hypothetical protein
MSALLKFMATAYMWTPFEGERLTRELVTGTQELSDLIGAYYKRRR